MLAKTSYMYVLQRRSWLQAIERTQIFISVQYILLAVTGWKEPVESAQALQMEKLVSLQYLPSCCLKFLDIAVQKCQFPNAEVMATQNTGVKQYHDNCVGLPSSPQKR